MNMVLRRSSLFGSRIGLARHWSLWTINLTSNQTNETIILYDEEPLNG
jgi:hypothetical protein